MLSLIYLAGAFGLAILAAADSTITIVASSDHGRWDGFGTSLAWWAKAFGDRDDLADIVFTLKTTKLNSVSLPGLGFNIARYNAGACSKNTYKGQSMVQSRNIRASRQIDGFWQDWGDNSSSSNSWNWNVDLNQRSMLKKAKARGANHFELFSNSAMWWMLKNHNPSGSNDGSSDNLQRWNYQTHAIYLAEIALHAQKNWDIIFESIEPFNEPSGDWWKGPTGTQEGCHFEISTMAAVISYLRSELDSRHLSNSIVSASDESQYDAAITTWKGLGSTARAKVGRINVHGYQKDGKRDALHTLASDAGKKLWNSEYGDNDPTGKELARNLILDFRLLQPTAWVYWQPVDIQNYGLIRGDNDDLTVTVALQKYFVLAQFSRHIREGMRILDGGSDNVVAAYDAVKKVLIIVAVNGGPAQKITFSLSKFSTAGKDGQLIPRWITSIGSGKQYVFRPSDTKQEGAGFSSDFASNEIMTFEVPGVAI